MPRPRNKTIVLEPGRTTTRITVSLEPETRERLERNAKANGFGHSLSAYVARLIELDNAKEETREKEKADIHGRIAQ